MASGVQLEKWFKRGFELYMGSAGILILTTLLVFLVSVFTFGILAGPMLAGLLMIGLRIHDKSEPAPQVGDLFKGFDHFKESFLLAVTAFAITFLTALVLNLVPVIGNILFYAIVSVIQLVVWFAMGRVVENGTPFWPAAQEAVEKIKTDLWPFVAFAVLITLAGGVGGLACGVGVCLTMPLYVCAMATAYRDTWSETEGGEVPMAPPSETGDVPPDLEVADAAPAGEPEPESGAADEDQAKPPPAG